MASKRQRKPQPDPDGATAVLEIEEPLNAEGYFAKLAIASVHECAHNPRQTFDPTKLEGLTTSIRAHGVQTPLLVRPRDDGLFEIAAGHRRYRAALAAGLTELPCVVRPMTDAEFVELLNYENLQREDLNAVEEAEGFRQLLELPGKDVDGIAAKLSMSTKYVYDRLKLLNLIPPAKQLLVEDRIDPGHGILIARQSPEEQRRIIDPTEGGLWQAERPDSRGLFDEDSPGRVRGRKGSGPFDGYKPVTVRELDAWIAANVRLDRDNLDERDHAETRATLFAAEEAEKPLKVVPITHLDFIPEGARDEKERTFLRRSWKRADGEPDQTAFPKVKKSKECEHSVLGIVVVGPDTARTFRVCTRKDKCRVHWAQSAKRKSKAAVREGAEDKRQERWKREQEQREVERKAWKRIAPGIVERVLAQVVAAEDVGPTGPLGRFLLDQVKQHGRKTPKVEGDSPGDLVRALAASAWSREVDREWRREDKECDALAKAFGVDIAAELAGEIKRASAEEKPAQTSAKGKGAKRARGRRRAS